MQVSHLYRRGVVVPLDDQTETQLRSGDVDYASNVHHVALTSDRIFAELWHLGFFDQINRHCDSMLDDYEEDVIECEAAPRILDAIESIKIGIHESEIERFMSDLKSLVQLALAHSRPIMFVL